MSNFIKLNKSFLDLNKYTNFTYIEVLLSLNIRVPHLCYHNQLPVSGNCRLCLGIIGADRKPAPLCATSVRPNDIVDYNSARVRRLRQDVLEFLLINHPMDCPSCDQGGECDLQDYSYNFGTDRSRHTFSYKKAILNVWEISFDSYLKLKDANNLDAYLHCNNIQQQRQIENFESRVHYMPVFIEKKYKRTKEYMMYRQQITRLHNIDQERKIQEYYSSALTDNSWNDKPIDSTGDNNNIFA